MMIKKHRAAFLTILFCAAASSHAYAAATVGASGLKVVAHLAGPDGGWDLATVDPDTRRLYLAHGSVVTAVDLDTGKVTPELIHGVRLHDVVGIKGTGRAASTNGDPNTVTIFEGADGKVVGEVPTGGKGPDALIQDPASGLLYVMNHRSGDIAVIDPAALKLVANIPVGGALELAVIDGKGRLYVNVEDKNEIASVDLATRKVIAHIPLKDCDGPTGLAYDPKTDILLASCDGVAKAVSARAGKEVASLKIGHGPDTVMFDPERSQFLVPARDGTLSVIAEESRGLKVIDTVTTQTGSRTGAVDPKTGRVYLPAVKYGPPAAAGGRPTTVPGTFEFLVLER